LLKKIRSKELAKEKELVAKLFKSQCYVCHRPFGKGFTFHHRFYTEGEKVYSDFKTTRSYLEYLLPLVRKTPIQYRLLCQKDHWWITWLGKFNRDKLNRIVASAKELR